MASNPVNPVRLRGATQPGSTHSSSSGTANPSLAVPGRDTKEEQFDESIHLREPSYLDPGTWSASFKFLPAYLALLAIFISLYVFRSPPSDDASSSSFFSSLFDGASSPTPDPVIPLDTSTPIRCAGTMNYTFAINDALNLLRDSVAGNPATLALTSLVALEVFDPQLTVFGPDPFPHDALPHLGFWSLPAGLNFLDDRVYFAPGGKAELPATEPRVVATGWDAVALAVPVTMLAHKWNRDARVFVDRVKESVSTEAGRFANGAVVVSGQDERVLRAEDLAVFAPFLAYYGVANGDVGIVRDAVEQIALYREQLLVRTGATKGLWRRVVGPAEVADERAWSTGNALTAWGMLRTRATIAAWTESNLVLAQERDDLDAWIGEILDAAIRTDDDGSELLRAYLGDKAWSGDSAGTSLMVAVAYRMATINPKAFANDKYLAWAHRKRRSVVSRVGDDGMAKPIINAFSESSQERIGVSPQGQAYLILMGTAWRDCACSGTCLDVYLQEHPRPSAATQVMPWDIAYEYFQSISKYLRGPGQ